MTKIIIYIVIAVCFGLFSCAKDEPSLPANEDIENGDNNDEDRPDIPQTETSGVINNHEWIDLGLSVRWASCNIGASQPYEFGEYYCWSGTVPKKYFYSWECDAHYKERYQLKSEGIVDGDYSLMPKYDAATVQWGGSWRIPTYKEILELIENCTWEITKVNNIIGYSATGPNGKSVFFPAAGHIVLSEHRNVGTGGSYWSSTPDNGVGLAYRLGFEISDDWVYWGYCGRECGLPVRPVTPK